MKTNQLLAILCTQSNTIVSVHTTVRFAEKAKAALIKEKPHMSYRSLPLSDAIDDILLTERGYLYGSCT